MGTQISTLPAPARQKKRLIRRLRLDNSQRLRHTIQIAFVLLNAWLGVQFYLWVRFFERGGVGLQVPRPAGAEGWLPIAGLDELQSFPHHRASARHSSRGHVSLHGVSGHEPSFCRRKSFCSWLCPVGTFSEALARVGEKIFRHNLRLPGWLDIPLRGLKYLLLAFFVFIIGAMPAATISDFMHKSYGLIADVKMLNFFREMGEAAAIVLAVLVLLSIVVENFWCRYLCPYGALMGLASLLSPLRIRRDPTACIDCARCATCLPCFELPVDKTGENSLRRSALRAWRALRPARQKVHCVFRSRPTAPTVRLEFWSQPARAEQRCRAFAGPLRPWPWPLSLPSSFWEPSSSRVLPTTGIPTFRILSIRNWCPTPIRPPTPAIDPGISERVSKMVARNRVVIPQG